MLNHYQRAVNKIHHNTVEGQKETFQALTYPIKRSSMLNQKYVQKTARYTVIYNFSTYANSRHSEESIVRMGNPQKNELKTLAQWVQHYK